MWQLAVFALVSSVPVGAQKPGVDGDAFGPQRSLTCIWFTNFENSRFEQCQDATGKLLQEGDGASIECVRDTCAQLDAAARKAAGWRKAEPPWGRFSVKLVGRLSLNPREKRYLGDSTQTVLVEAIASVRVSK